MSLSVRLLSTRRVHHVLVRAIACGTLLVLSSCGIPHFRQAEPGPGLPTTFNGEASSDNSAQLTIKEFFNDPTLTHLIDQALACNRELLILNEDVQIAKSEILARQGAYHPSLGFGGTARLDRYSKFTLPGAGIQDDPYILPDKFLPNPLPDYLLGLALFWRVDIWRELRNAKDAAALRYAAAAERRNYFVTRLVAEIAEHYYGLMARDKRLENLDKTIQFQQQNQKLAEARLKGARGNVLAVQRFQAEVRKLQSQKLLTRQEIVQIENRINLLLNRIPQPVERNSEKFLDLTIHALSLGVPAQLLLNRPDIRQAERELEATGLDVKVARAHFFPKLEITGGVGYEAFNPKYLFWTPQAMVANAAGNLTSPLLNKKAIQADFLTANARQLQSVYNYQRTILNAFTEVVTRLAMVQNYSKSIEIRKQQLESLDAAVGTANKLFFNARIEYVDVLFAQRDMWEARLDLIDTKERQLVAIVNAYQALGGGDVMGRKVPPFATDVLRVAQDQGPACAARLVTPAPGP